MKKITLQIGADDFAFAERLAKSDGYSDPEDCLNGILNMASLRWRDHVDDHTPEQAEIKHLKNLIDRQDAEIRVLKSLVADAMRSMFEMKKEYREVVFGEFNTPPHHHNGGDLDDDIPF